MAPDLPSGADNLDAEADACIVGVAACEGSDGKILPASCLVTPLSVEAGLGAGGIGTGNKSVANGSVGMPEGNTNGAGSMDRPVADKYAKKLRGESGVPSARTGRTAAAGIRSE